MTTLSKETKIGMTIGQLIALFFFILSVGGGYTALQSQTSDAASQAYEAKQATMENAKRIERIERERALDNKEIMNMIHEIRESQIRIEGKLDLKMDKYNN